ncbi:hypothetical protein, partial [Streptomyces violaceusniger]|uniref:hypothetical protein n=1 Tax=Streptomyces violaceusniger TaxID=68280 RepID=UPI003812F7EC
GRAGWPRRVAAPGGRAGWPRRVAAPGGRAGWPRRVAWGSVVHPAVHDAKRRAPANCHKFLS